MSKTNLFSKNLGLYRLGIVLGWLWFLATTVTPASAQDIITPADLIAEVNALRAARGLAPYQVDDDLMAYSQEHTDYQAANRKSTHVHSDGTLPWDRGISENVAVGTENYINTSMIVNQIWADEGHMKTMVSYMTGLVGAGVARGGGSLYFTLDVRPTGGTATPDPNITTNDLINAVNTLRASRGLAPYQTDSWLMSYAQAHSEYQAENQISVHSSGGNPWGFGIQENIAAGMYHYVTIGFIMNDVWSDDVHMKTMIGNETGWIGAGVAHGTDDWLYFTIDVRGGDEPTKEITFTATVSGTPPTATIGPTQPRVASVLAVTPAPDGSITHTVQPGQTLWTIAAVYGISLDDLRKLNDLTAESPIQPGQKLLIRKGVTATPSLRPSATLPERPNGQWSEASGSSTQQSTGTPTPKATPEPPADNAFTGREIGIGLVVLCGGGLLYFWFKSFSTNK